MFQTGMAVLLSAVLARGVEPSAPADVVDRILALRDSLTVWAEHPPSLAAEIPESFDLSTAFPGATLLDQPENGEVAIILPRFHDIVSGTLLLQTDSSGLHWSLTPEERASLLPEESPDSGEVHPEEASTALLDVLAQRLIGLRTLGLPPVFQPPPPATDALVEVTLRGRDLDQLAFSFAAWWRSLAAITQGMTVYAGILDRGIKRDEADITWFLFLTTPGARGHHFLRWRERFRWSGAGWISLDNRVRFLPYVRTDNLHDLFAAPDTARHFNSQVPIYIRGNNHGEESE